MFTGIITSLGTIESIEPKGSAHCVWIQTGFRDVTLGESIAVNGVCLTAAELKDDGRCLFYISEETHSCSNLKSISVHQKVNLERALRAQDRLSGHWVQGHVDGTGFIHNIQQDPSGGILLQIQIPGESLVYTVSKGSITLDGVSLTINSIEKNLLSFLLIPHTWSETCFQYRSVGDSLNIEYDILAKLTENTLLRYQEKFQTNPVNPTKEHPSHVHTL